MVKILVKKFDKNIRILVSNGSVWPVDSNTPITLGTTYTSISITIKRDIIVSTIGYTRAWLIFCLRL